MLKYNRYKNNDKITTTPPHSHLPLKDLWAELHFAIHRIMINIALFISYIVIVIVAYFIKTRLKY